MRLTEMTFMGLPIWPPQWSSSSHRINDRAVLQDVRVIVGTELLRIDIDQNGIPHMGVMFVAKTERPALLQQLKEHLGRSLSEIAAIEINTDLVAPRKRAAMGGA